MSVGSISTLGVGSGLELQSILDDLREVDEKQRIAPLENNITNLQSQLEAFDTVQSKLLEMRGHLRDLSLESTYLSSTVSSTDETVIEATVINGAAEQSASISVSRLATKSAWLTDGLAAKDTSINESGGDLTFDYTVGDGDTVSVTVPDGTTLEGMAELINSDENNAGVTARIIDSGDPSTPFKLMLQADETGSNNSIAISATPVTVHRQEADPYDLNAALTVDNISYARQSNSFDDVLTGATLTLNKVGDSFVSIKNDTQAYRDTIVGLVESYNEVVQEIGTNVSYDEESGEFGVLARTTVQGLRHELQSLMTSIIDSGEGDVTSLFDLGMEFSQDGTITLDTAVLDQALADDSDGVRAFFLGDSDQDIEGFADKVYESLGNIASSGGLIETEKSTAESRISDLEDRILSETDRLNRRYDVLNRQFIQLDSYMNQMTSMSNYLQGQFDSLSGLSNDKK